MKAKIRFYHVYGTANSYTASVEYRNTVYYSFSGLKSEKDSLIAKACLWTYNAGFNQIEFIKD